MELDTFTAVNSSDLWRSFVAQNVLVAQNGVPNAVQQENDLADLTLFWLETIIQSLDPQ